jgi:Family of unknown function (DUF6049)
VVSGGPGSPRARHYSRCVLRPSSLSRALTGVAAAVLLAGLAASGLVPAAPGSSPAAAASAAPPDPAQPLLVRMSSITPDYIPAKGPVVIRGTITNDSDQEWTAINVEGFVGRVPITTTAELAAAARTPVTADVGHRITDPGTFDTVASLQPGQTARFTVRLPRSKITVSTPGVYWFGVHALADSAAGRITAGRDRTFLPLVPPVVANSRVEQTSLVLPVRAGVTRGADGTIQDVDRLLHSLRSGPLHHVVSTGVAARGRPLTWVVDPSVVDVVRRLAQGNPPRTLVTPTTQNPPPGGPSSSPSSGATASGSADAASDDAPPPTEVAKAAKRWLRQLHQVLSIGTAQVMGLPYGDLEVDSAVRYDRPLLVAAIHRTGPTLSPWGVPLSPVVVPPTGRMGGPTLGEVPRSSTVLLEDTAIRGAAPAGATVNDRRVVLSSSGAAEGGPGPVDPLSPLALRQRILSEAALRLLGDQQPLVVQLTALHQPLTQGFFSGLEVPWLQLTTLDGATAGSTALLSGARLRTPVTDSLGLGPAFYPEADRVIEDGATLQSVLPENHVLRRQIFDETAGNASYSSAEDPVAALARVRSTSSWVNGNLSGVALAAPEKVTLASATGHFSALVSNDLDVPVTVKVRAVTDPQITITGGEAVQLAPHGRTSVLLTASTHVLGVHSVTLELTNLAGRPLGAQDSFPMRAEAVSRLIWVILGAGVALLFGAIVVRLTRRLMRSRTS